MPDASVRSLDVYRAPFSRIFSPAAAFSPALSWRAALWPLALATTVELWLAYLTQPFVLQAVRAVAPPTMSEVLEMQLAASLRFFMLGAVTRPAAFCIVVTLVLFGLLVASGHVARLGRLLAVVATANLVLALKHAYVFGILQARGIGSISGPGDLEARVGLGAFLPVDDPVLLVVVESINLFDIWFLVLITIAIQRTEQASTRAAGVIVLVAGLLACTYRIVLAALTL